jgi:hypothetical protein
MFIRPPSTSLYAQLQAYSERTNVIPDTTFLIWFGNGVLNTEEFPYVKNIVLHKSLNSETTVRLYIAKELFTDNDKYTELLTLCNDNGIVLLDINESCTDYLNYDIVHQLIAKPEDYARAAAHLALSILFETGGRYFDCDLVPIKKYEIFNPAYGFLQYSPDPMKGIANYFSFHASVPKHLIYFYSSVVNRMIHLLLPNDGRPDWMYSLSPKVRQEAICTVSGNPITYLFQYTSLRRMFLSDINAGINYPLAAVVKLNEGGPSWIDAYHTRKQFTDAEFDLMLSQNTRLTQFTQKMVGKFVEGMILHLGEQYFPGVEVEKFNDAHSSQGVGLHLGRSTHPT